MRRTAEELLSAFRAIVGEDNAEDTTISFIEDLTDTLPNEEEDWKLKYEQNDAEWRKRYMERFYGGEVSDSYVTEQDESTINDTQPREETITIDDLFTKKEVV